MINNFYRIEAGETGAIENPNLEVNFKYYRGGFKVKRTLWHRVHMWWLWKRSRKAWTKYLKVVSEKEFDNSIGEIVRKFIESEK